MRLRLSFRLRLNNAGLIVRLCPREVFNIRGIEPVNSQPHQRRSDTWATVSCSSSAAGVARPQTR